MCFNSPFEMVQRLHDHPRAGGGGDDGEDSRGDSGGSGDDRDEGGRGSVDDYHQWG